MAEEKRRTYGTGSVLRPRAGQRHLRIQYYVGGRRVREVTSYVPGQEKRAERLLRTRLAAADAGGAVGPNVDRTRLADLVGLLRNDYRVNKRRSEARMELSVRHLLEHLGDQLLAVRVTEERVAQYIVERSQAGAANATINRELAALKRAFKLGLKMRRVARAPWIELLEEANARKGFFEEDQVAAVVAHLPAPLRPVVLTGCLTGWRKSEILTRRRHHLDLRKQGTGLGWLRLDPGETKNGRGRNFPLTPELRAILEAQEARTRELELQSGRIIPWLFHRDGEPILDFDRAWRRACREAGLAGRLFHDLRRTAARDMERRGVARSVAKALIGHLTDSIYARYAILDDALLLEQVRRLGGGREGLRDTIPTPISAEGAEKA